MPLSTRVAPIRSVALAALVTVASLGAQTPASSSYAALDSLSPPAPLAAAVTLKGSTTLRAAIADVARQTNVSIVFDPALPGLDRVVRPTIESVSAAKALMRLLDGTEIRAMVTAVGSIVLTERPKRGDTRSFVAGTIRQPSGPLGGVRLTLFGTRFAAMTDAAGRFNFGSVPAGDYSLRALRMGFAPVTKPVRVDATDSASSLELTMFPAAVPVDAVIVTPGYVGVMQPGITGSQALTRQQIETVPQLGEDVYRTIGRLPGVASDDYSAKFDIRGESVEALYVTLDGLPLVEPFHLRDIGSALSIVDLASLGRAELIAGGPSAEYGDQLAGVFKLYSVEPRSDRARTSVGISLTNLRAMSQGGFANGRGSWMLSGRRGFLDLAFKLAKLDDSLSPRYNDVFAKVSYMLPGGTRLAAHALHAGDRMRYIGTGEPSLDSRYTSDYAWVTLDGRVGSRLRQQTVAWITALDWRRSGIEIRGTPTININDVRALHTLGFREDWSFEMSPRALLKAGAELTHETATYDYSKFHLRNVIGGGAVQTRLDSGAVNMQPKSDQIAAYLSQRIRPFDALTLELGARYDRASHTGDAYVSPRFNAAWQPTTSTTVRASVGTHAQSQSIFGLQVEDGVTAFQSAERARQGSIGIDQIVWSGITLRAEAYDRDVRNVRSRYINAMRKIDPLSEINPYLTFVAPTRAHARGVELSIDRDGGRRIDWSTSYVISSSRQELGGAWIPRPTEQPRALRADWSFHPISNRWRVSLSGVRHSGWPYTPEVVRVDTIVSGTNKSIWVTRSSGALFSRRTTPYQRFDARWTRFFDTRSGRVSMFVDVYNVLNNANERERYTSVSINTLRTSLQEGSRVSLPRIPSFGINWEF